MDNTPDQKKPVTLFSATMMGIANMMGTGVFTTLGLQLAGVHSPFCVLMLWVLGGVSAFCGALSYGELGAMMPRSGGEYTYLSRIYHPAVGFLSGVISMVASFPAPIALAAIAFSHYLTAVFPGFDQTVAAVAAIAVLTFVHLVDVGFGCRFQNVFTVSKILLIVAFIASGLFVSQPQGIVLLPSQREVESLFSPTFAVSLVYVSYAYSGWNASAYIAGEIPRPERNLPISLFSATIFVSLCYVLLNFIFLHTVPVTELAGRIDIGYLSARAVFGETGSRIMTLLVCLALISSMSSMIMVGPRIAQTMGEDFKTIRIFARRNSRGSPVYAMLFQSATAALLAITSAFDVVLTYVGFTMALFDSITVFGVFILRVRQPHRERPFKAWGYPLTPALHLILNGWMLFYLFIQRPLSSTIVLLVAASTLLLCKMLANAKDDSFQ
jgi:basic amino acid/polyamine antiporter, APA family